MKHFCHSCLINWPLTRNHYLINSHALMQNLYLFCFQHHPLHLCWTIRSALQWLLYQVECWVTIRCPTSTMDTTALTMVGTRHTIVWAARHLLHHHSQRRWSMLVLGSQEAWLCLNRWICPDGFQRITLRKVCASIFLPSIS